MASPQTTSADPSVREDFDGETALDVAQLDQPTVVVTTTRAAAKQVAADQFTLYNRRVTRISDSSVHDIECPLCAELKGEPRFAIESLASQVVVCGACGFGFLHPLPSPAEIAGFYPPAYYGSTGRKFTGVVEFAIRLVASRHVKFLASRVPRGGRILDVGCGRGVLLRQLADRGFEAHGFEVSESAAVGVDSRIQLRIADDLCEAEYPDGHFDQVIIWHVLEHVCDPRATIDEIRRILKPGGEVVVAVPNFSSLQARWSGPAWFHLDLPRHLYHFPAAALARLLEESGFRITSSHHFSLRQNPFGWVQSALNKLTWLPRNALYELLHQRNGNRPRMSWLTRATLLAAFALGMPFALLVEVVAAMFRSGATVHFVARRGV